MALSRAVSSESEWRRGWPVVAGSAIMAGTGSGLYQNLSSLFMPGLVETLGTTRGGIGAAAGFGLLGALAAPWIGRLADRFGVVAVMVASGLGIAATHLWFAAMTGGLWRFQLGVGLLAIFASGYSALIYGRLIARRFDRHRGIALAIATSGLSFMTLFMPALFGWIIATWGWHAGYWVLAALALVVGLPAGLIAVRAAGALESRLAVQRAEKPPSWRDATFWRLAGATMMINVGTVGMVTQMAMIGGDRGFSLESAGLLLSAYGLSQIVGRLLMGVLIDRFPANRIAAVFGLVSAMGFAALLSGFGGLAFVAVAVFLAGLLNGAEYDLLPYLVSRLFPLPVYSEIFGRLLLFSIFSGGIGLASFGLLHDWTGSYAAPLAMSVVLVLLAAVLLYGLPRYDPRGEPSVLAPDEA